MRAQAAEFRAQRRVAELEGYLSGRMVEPTQTDLEPGDSIALAEARARSEELPPLIDATGQGGRCWRARVDVEILADDGSWDGSLIWEQYVEAATLSQALTRAMRMAQRRLGFDPGHRITVEIEESARPSADF